MLLNSITATKAAYDIIHDAEEFFAKWPLLVQTASENPKGLVDFEFSDGSVVQMPCAWIISGMSESVERAELTFRRRDTIVSWKPGSADTFQGLLSDAPVAVRALSANSIAAITSASGAPLEIIDAVINAITAASLSIYNANIDSLSVSGNAAIISPIFANITAKDFGRIDMDMDSLAADSIVADAIQTDREKIVPVLKMNAWSGNHADFETDAVYTGTIPFAPFSADARPINGFNKKLADNPFYPDWLYANRDPAAEIPAYAWVPSIRRPDSPCWRDTDNLYWHLADIYRSSYGFGYRSAIYPPRYSVPGSSDIITPPVKSDADGLIVTVKALEGSAFIASYDRYVYNGANTWEWFPNAFPIAVNEPSIVQCVLKRSFTIINGEITQFEYQFLPLGASV